MSIVFLIIFSLFIGTVCYLLERKMIRRAAFQTWRNKEDAGVVFPVWLKIAKVAAFAAFTVACFLVLLAYELCKTLYLTM